MPVFRSSVPDATSSPQKKESTRSKLPCNPMRYAQTSHKRPTPPSAPAVRVRQDSASSVRWTRRERRPRRSAAHHHATRPRTHVLRIRLFLSERPSFPESRLNPRRLQLVLTFVRSLCPLRALCKILFFCPQENWPIISKRDTRQIARRIHRRGLSDRLEHPLVTRSVSIREASPQIQLQLRCDSPNSPRFRLAKHRFAHDSPSPAAGALFQAS